MEDQDKYNESQTGIQPKERLATLLNSAVVVIIIPALVFIISFAYNGGYNSYYGIPIFLTNASPITFLRNIPFITNYVPLVFLSGFIFLIFWRLMNQMRRRKRIEKNVSIVFVSVFCLVLSIIFFVFGILAAKIVNIVVGAFLILLSILMFYVIIKLRTPKNELDQKFEEKQRKYVVGIVPKLKLSINLIYIMLIGIIFAIVFTVGMFQAAEQDYYYVVDNNSKAIISIYETHAVSVNLHWDSEYKKYTFDSDYEMLPLDNLKFSRVYTGQVKPKKDVIDMIIFF